MPRRIVDISSATGWSAELRSDEPGEPNRRVTLVAWALVEDGDERDVVGLVLHPRSADAPTGRIGPADEVPAFVGYAFGGIRTQSD